MPNTITLTEIERMELTKQATSRTGRAEDARCAVANQPRGKEIHAIADNLSTHKTKRVDARLAEHHNVQLHFTPTYSSWLNQSNSGSPRSNAT